MTANASFRSYLPTDIESCLQLFDANCPEFFAPNERRDYEDFLCTHPATYELCVVEESIVGVFGLMGSDVDYRSLNWIMLDPTSHGLGLGTAIMERVVQKARELAVQTVAIAASQKSAPFFAKFGAIEQATTENGWGPGMHRVDMDLAL